MINIFFLIFSYLLSYESSIPLFYMKPSADVFGCGGIVVVPFIENEKATSSPALLSNIKTDSLSGSFWRDYIGSGYYSFFSYSHKIDKENGLSLSYYGYSSGTEQIYNFDGSYDELVFERDSLFSFSYGSKISNGIALGASGKYIRSTLAEKYSGSTFLFDFDAVLNTHNWIFRFAFENAGGKIKYAQENQDLPLMINFELAKLFYFDKIALSFGGGMRRSRDYKNISFGTNIILKNIPLSFSFGYKIYNDLNQYVIGSGLSLENMYVNFAMAFPQIAERNEFRISISYFFDSPKKSFYNYDSLKDYDNKNKKKKENDKIPKKIKKEENKIQSDIIIF